MTDLLPCPFCGKQPHDFTYGKVRSIGCDLHTTNMNYAEQWNTRPSQSNSPSVPEDVAEAVKYFTDEKYRNICDGAFDYINHDEMLNRLIRAASKPQVEVVTRKRFNECWAIACDAVRTDKEPSIADGLFKALNGVKIIPAPTSGKGGEK